MEQPHDHDHQDQTATETPDYCDTDAGEHLLPAVPDDDIPSRHLNGGASNASHDTVALARGEAEVGGECTPEDDGQRSGGGRLQVDGLNIDDAFSYSRRHRRAREGTGQVEDGGHDHGGPWRQDPS